MTAVEKRIPKSLDDVPRWRDPLPGENGRVSGRARLIQGEDLNNFFCNLPGGVYRAREFQSAFLPDESFGAAIERAAREKGRTIRSEDLEGYSLRKLAQTPEQFFAAVDEALLQCGIDGEAIAFCITMYCSADGDRAKLWESVKSIHRATLPAYVLLRELGYSHRDLAG